MKATTKTAYHPYGMPSYNLEAGTAGTIIKADNVNRPRHILVTITGNSSQGFVDIVACPECKTEFHTSHGLIKCNGRAITWCPWCSPDSKPWAYGRGE